MLARSLFLAASLGFLLPTPPAVAQQDENAAHVERQLWYHLQAYMRHTPASARFEDEMGDPISQADAQSITRILNETQRGAGILEYVKKLNSNYYVDTANYEAFQSHCFFACTATGDNPIWVLPIRDQRQDSSLSIGTLHVAMQKTYPEDLQPDKKNTYDEPGIYLYDTKDAKVPLSFHGPITVKRRYFDSVSAPEGIHEDKVMGLVRIYGENNNEPYAIPSL